MKYLVYIFLILLLIGCGSTRKFQTSFFELYTSSPGEIIDSISKADTLEIPIQYKEGWNKSMYITSDSVMTTQYVGLWVRKDTTYIISITEEEGDSIVYLKYRKE